MDGDSKKPDGARSQVLRVYLTEDSPIMASLMTDLLANESGVEVCGHSVNAREAAARITEAPPDVAIVDIALENSSGFDVLRALSALPKNQRPVTMVLSNFALPRYRAEAKRLGADHFFDKNGEIVELLKAVRALVRARQAGAASGP